MPIGAVYYLIVGRTKRFAPVVVLSEDHVPFAVIWVEIIRTAALTA